jgi:hypothetical protein
VTITPELGQSTASETQRNVEKMAGQVLETLGTLR